MGRRVGLVVAVGSLWVVALLAGPSHAGGSCSDGEFTDRRTTEISMVAMCFTPTVARIDEGATVTFRNDDATLHAVGGVTNVFGNLHTELPQGKSLSYTFDEEGVFPYMCILHPGMGGAIVVGDGEGPTAQAAAFAPSDPGARALDEPSGNGSAVRSGLLGVLGLGLAAFAVRGARRRLGRPRTSPLDVASASEQGTS